MKCVLGPDMVSERLVCSQVRYRDIGDFAYDKTVLLLRNYEVFNNII